MTRPSRTTTAPLTLHQVSAGPGVPGANGEPIVFLHSLGCDLHLWETVAAAFAPRHRVVRYDLRGHGLSEVGPTECTIDDNVGDLTGLLDRLGIAGATLVGISVGGMIALAAAWRHPQRFRRLVLCGTAAQIGTREGWTERIEAIRTRGLDGMADTVLARWFAPEFFAREPAVVRTYRNILTRTPVAGYLAMCTALRDADLRQPAAEVRGPVLVLSGEHDIPVPPATGRELAGLLPDARWSLIRGTAHLPPIEQPGATIDAITRFLADTA